MASRYRTCVLEGMVQASPAYEPRRPAQGVLFRIVRDHFETLRGRAATLREGDGLPRCHARQDGFDLEAGVRVGADQRDRLERLCRHVLRPPVADQRLRVLDDGDVLLVRRTLEHRRARLRPVGAIGPI